MPRLIEERIERFLEEIDSLPRSYRMTAIRDFLTSQLELRNVVYEWTEKDLNAIHSRAISVMLSLSTRERLEGKNFELSSFMAQLFSIAQATYETMRAKKLTPYVISLKKENYPKICDHCQARPVIENGNVKFICPDCDSEVKPILWSNKS